MSSDAIQVPAVRGPNNRWTDDAPGMAYINPDHVTDWFDYETKTGAIRTAVFTTTDRVSGVPSYILPMGAETFRSFFRMARHADLNDDRDAVRRFGQAWITRDAPPIVPAEPPAPAIPRIPRPSKTFLPSWTSPGRAARQFGDQPVILPENTIDTDGESGLREAHERLRENLKHSNPDPGWGSGA